jgi:tetratricopeptide (TPR) repeat protein
MAAEPVPPLARYRYANFYLVLLGRVPDAMEQYRLGLETDPLSMLLHMGMVRVMYLAKQYREAIAYARNALEIDPNFHFIWHLMGRAQLHVGLTREAIASLKRGVELAPWESFGAWFLAAAYHLAGDRERSQEWAGKLAESHGRTVAAAWYYAAIGEVDALFEALDGAYRERDPGLSIFQNEPFFDPYRAGPRFQALLRRMTLA